MRTESRCGLKSVENWCAFPAAIHELILSPDCPSDEITRANLSRLARFLSRQCNVHSPLLRQQLEARLIADVATDERLCIHAYMVCLLRETQRKMPRFSGATRGLAGAHPRRYQQVAPATRERRRFSWRVDYGHYV